MRAGSCSPGVVIQDWKTDRRPPFLLSIFAASDCHRTQAQAQCLPAQTDVHPTLISMKKSHTIYKEYKLSLLQDISVPVPVRPCKEDKVELVWEGGNIRKTATAWEEGGVCLLLLSGPQQPGRMRRRPVTGSDAGLIALSRFHAHFSYRLPSLLNALSFCHVLMLGCYSQIAMSHTGSTAHSLCRHIRTSHWKLMFSFDVQLRWHRIWIWVLVRF